ncbi:hypothetical protein JY97_10560 [Alkalispirochaeta odontotermitis]|nr:hypothetical protein JY97_10560 [Alkalispirochaeta odontotermitis]CAB1079402.1 Dihydrolipoamide acetyltransferase component of pyruvate dehydrogenase complex (EC [Olavius algarvensis Delta 1 endosymbiont]
MAVEIVMPKLAMAMKRGKVVEWLANDGDLVEKGRLVMVVETEKVTYELEAPATGFLHILIGVDQEVKVNTTLALLAETEEELGQIRTEQPAGAAAATPEIESVSPTEQPAAGLVEAVGGALAPPASVSPAAENINAITAHQPAAVSVPQVPENSRGRIAISPLAKSIAADHQLDIRRIVGTGPEGRIKKRDVIKALESGVIAVATPMDDGWSGEMADGKRVKTRLPLTGMRRALADHMRRSLSTAARVTVFAEIDMTEMIKLRQGLVKRAEVLGSRISYTDLAVFIAARALKEVPLANSTMTEDHIVVWEDINIGVAFSLSEGDYGTDLVVPVLKQTGNKSLVEISTELKEMVNRGRNGKLTLDDMSGGTFTITNTAMLLDRWHIQTPIITQPESTILGTSAIVEKPVIVDGEIVARPMMPISLSFDHRVMDGSQPTRFIGKLCELMEQPDYLLAQLR